MLLPMTPTPVPVPRPMTLTPSRAAGRVGGRRKKLDAGKRREIAKSVVAGRKRCRHGLALTALPITSAERSWP